MRATIAGRLGPGVIVPAIAAAVVLMTVLAVWLGAGVTLGEACRFGAYEAVYVFLPGWILHEALQPGLASRLRRILFAFALGQVIEVLAFTLTAGLGARWLFTLYPLAFLLAAAIRGRRGAARAGAIGPWTRWRVDPGAAPAWSLALAAVCLLSLGYLVVVHFISVPLPARIGAGFTYEHDYVFHLSLAGEALHHWPVSNPNVAGTSLAYHWLSYFHIAAAAQVTGISLPTVYFALFQAPLLLLLLAELALVGSTLGGKLWAGPLAAFMLVFIGELDLSKIEPSPFLEAMPIYLRYSPGFLFAATLLVPLLLALCEALQTKRPSRSQWAIIALLAVGCAGGDGPSLPPVLGGACGYLGYRWLIDRRLDRRALTAIGLLAGVLVLAVAVVYGGSSGGLELAFPGVVDVSPPFAYELMHVPDGFHGLYWVMATVLLIMFLFGATLAGLFWLPRRLSRLRAQEVVPLGAFLCGLLALVFLVQASGGQEYFAMYGLMAVLPISAAGLVRLFAAARGGPRRPWALTAFAIACLGVAWIVTFGADLGASPNVDDRFLLVDGGFALLVVVLAVWALASPPGARTRRAVFPVIVVLAAAAINVPSDYRSRFDHLWSGENLAIEAGPGLTPDLYTGLRWIRAHTPDDAVLAVDNLRTPSTRSYGPLYFYVSAFSERRTLMQGWEYTTKGSELGATAVQLLEEQPYPERLALEDAVFEQADAVALRTLQRRYGVTELVVDRANGKMSPELRSIAQLVYSNPALLVFSPRRG